MTTDEAGEVAVDGLAVGGYHVERDERGRVVSAAFWGAMIAAATIAEVDAAVRAADEVDDRVG